MAWNSFNWEKSFKNYYYYKNERIFLSVQPSNNESWIIRSILILSDESIRKLKTVENGKRNVRNDKIYRLKTD